MDSIEKATRPELSFRPDRSSLDKWNHEIGELTAQESLSATMKALACIVDEYESRKMDHIQCIVYQRALDWLATLKDRLSQFKAIEYRSGSADSDGRLVPGTEYVKCMAYNTKVISDEDAEEVLRQGLQSMDDRVVDLWPSQARALFPDLAEKPE